MMLEEPELPGVEPVPQPPTLDPRLEAMLLRRRDAYLLAASQQADAAERLGKALLTLAHASRAHHGHTIGKMPWEWSREQLVSWQRHKDEWRGATEAFSDATSWMGAAHSRYEAIEIIVLESIGKDASAGHFVARPQREEQRDV